MQVPHHGAAGGLAIAAAGFQKRHAGIEGHLHQRLQLIAAELVGFENQFQRQAQLHHRRNLIVQGCELAIEQQGEVRHQIQLIGARFHSALGFRALQLTAAGAKGKAQHADQTNAAALPQPLAGLWHPARSQADAGKAVMQGLLAAALD